MCLDGRAVEGRQTLGMRALLGGEAEPLRLSRGSAEVRVHSGEGLIRPNCCLLTGRGEWGGRSTRQSSCPRDVKGAQAVGS